MKVARVFAVVFAVVGMVLLLVCPIVFLANRNSPVKITESPQGALVCSETLAAGVNEGNYAAIAEVLYGQPKLGAGDVPADGYTALLWETFRSEMTFSYSSKLYLLDGELARDAVITVPDIARILELVEKEATALLEQQAQAAEDPRAVFTAEGGYRPELMEQALQNALGRVLQGEVPCISCNVTVKLIFRDDQWWAVPDQTFLKAISGLAA